MNITNYLIIWIKIFLRKMSQIIKKNFKKGNFQKKNMFSGQSFNIRGILLMVYRNNRIFMFTIYLAIFLLWSVCLVITFFIILWKYEFLQITWKFILKKLASLSMLNVNVKIKHKKLDAVKKKYFGTQKNLQFNGTDRLCKVVELTM